MSRSGRQFRDPFNLQARRRKAGPIGPTKRQREIELLERELDEESRWWDLNDILAAYPVNDNSEE